MIKGVRSLDFWLFGFCQALLSNVRVAYILPADGNIVRPKLAYHSAEQNAGWDVMYYRTDMTLGQKLIISRLAQILKTDCQNLPNISNNRKFCRSHQDILFIYFSRSNGIKTKKFGFCPNFQTDGYSNFELPKRREIRN
jgi:hypothetical protein